MKKHLAFLLLPILIIACGAQDFSIDTKSSQVTFNTSLPSATPSAGPSATATFTPTPTVGWQETAVISQATADAALRLMVDATAAEDQRIFAQSAWTVTAEAYTHEADMLTAQSNMWTMTAYPTYLPITQTVQARRDIAAATQAADMRTALHATLNAPTQVIAMSNAQAQAKYADLREKSTIFIYFSIGSASVLLSLYLLVIAFRSAPAVHIVAPEEPKFIQPIPFTVKKQDGSTVWTRAEVPCTKEQLVEFADGIINRNMTCSFGMWEGNKLVHKSLKAIREFLIEHHFAKLVRGSGGAMDLTAEGEQFLHDTIAHNAPPAPYRCIETI
jgi:hypothetical protein